MRKWVIVGVAAFVLVAAVLVGAVAITRLRSDAARTVCQDNLRSVGGFGLAHAVLPGETVPDPESTVAAFPPGTVVNPELPVEQRLSWIVTVLPALELQKRVRAELSGQIDLDRAWDKGANNGIAKTRMDVLLCPEAERPRTLNDIDVTQYVGLAGLGTDAAEATFGEWADVPATAGVFRYSRATPRDWIFKGDGLDYTVTLGETNRDLGPWLRGGPSTVRGLDVGEGAYVGDGAPFGGCHPKGGYFSFASGRVAFVTEKVDREVFRRLLTIAGGEE